MKKITGYLVDVENRSCGKVELEPKLETYYKLLNCDLIDIVCRKIGGKYYDIIVDDEGLFKEKPKASAYMEDGTPLVGNILVVGTPDMDDENGRERTLSVFDIRNIESAIRYTLTDGRPVLFGLGY